MRYREVSQQNKPIRRVALWQVTDRGYKVSEVAQRLGVTTKSLHNWRKRYGDQGSRHQAITEQRE